MTSQELIFLQGIKQLLSLFNNSKLRSCYQENFINFKIRLICDPDAAGIEWHVHSTIMSQQLITVATEDDN